MHDISSEDYNRAAEQYHRLWWDLSDADKKVINSSFEIFLKQGGHGKLWVARPQRRDWCLRVTDDAKKKIEMMLSPHAPTLFKAYIIQTREIMELPK